MEASHSQALDAWVARDNGCGGALIVGNKHGDGGQWFSLVPVDQFVADPSLDCPPTTLAPTTTPLPTTTPAPTTAPAPTAAPTTPVPTTTVSVNFDGQCTDDGSNVEADEFIIQNDRDLYVIADDGSGTAVLQKRDTSDLSASSLQTWQYAPLCNGKVQVVNIGTGNPLSSGPWTYDPESKLLQSDSGRWARSIKKHKLRMEGRVRYLKGTTTPWRWFQWNIVKV